MTPGIWLLMQAMNLIRQLVDSSIPLNERDRGSYRKRMLLGRVMLRVDTSVFRNI